MKGSFKVFFIFGALFELGLILPAIIAGWFFSVNPFEKLTYSPKAIVVGVVTSLIMFVFYLLLDRFPLGVLKSVKKVLANVADSFLYQANLFQLFVLGMLAGIGEEVLFRGFLQTWLIELNWLNSIWPAIIVTNLVFAICHPISKTYMMLVFLVGVPLSLLYYYSDNLLTVILAHGLYDVYALWHVRTRALKKRSLASFAEKNEEVESE